VFLSLCNDIFLNWMCFIMSKGVQFWMMMWEE
jgi:hypothetical protein